MNNPVILDTLGGLISAARPEELPEGASPQTNDTDFTIGRVIQRPGEQNVYSYANSGLGPNGPASVSNIAFGGNSWINIANIQANDGVFTTNNMTNVPTSNYAISNVQVVQKLGYPSSIYYLEVTFTNVVPSWAAGQQYNFSGLTHYTLLNGQTVSSIPYYINSLAQAIYPATNQAFFIFGTSSYPYTADTGTGKIPSGSIYESDIIQAQNFGFTIPLTNSVGALRVNVKGYSAGTATVYAQMVKAGVATGQILYNALPSSSSFVTFQSYQFGIGFQAADINNTGFGVNIWATSTTSSPVYLDYVDIQIFANSSTANFNGMGSAALDEFDNINIALDANGASWEENTLTAPNILSAATLIPPATPGSYMKSIDSGDGSIFMAYSDLTQGISQPMQYNGQWSDRITQVGPGAPPFFTPSTIAGTQASITGYAYSAGILTLTSVNTFTAGLLVSFSNMTAGAAALNGLTLSVLGTGLSGTQFQVATTVVSGSGSTTGFANPQYTYPIAASPTGITQPPQMSGIDTPGHFEGLLWSTGPGSKTAGNVITVYYSNVAYHPNPDQVLTNAFNNGYPVYIYISGANFGNGTWQVTSVGQDTPPGAGGPRWYFTYNVPTSQYQYIGGSSSTGYYQITQATVTTTTAVPGLSAGGQVSLANVTNASWDGVYVIVEALNSGSYSITQTSVTGGVATYTWALISGIAPAAGMLVTVTNTLNANGTLNVTDALIATASGTVSGTFTVNGFTGSNYGTVVESGLATTAGTQFVIDPGAALVGNTVTNPIFGNSGGGTLTVVGSSLGSTFPIGAGTRQGVVFFITRNGAVTRPSPASTFTVATGANYIIASNIPIGPPNVIARGIAFTEAGSNGIAGANFYTYDVPVIFTVGGVTYTASALIVPDNVTTTMQFTFSDSVLLASDEIDVQGNDYFNLIELGDPAWIFKYANRALYGLCQTKVQNFLNMSFDGGYLANSGSVYPMPLGWQSNGNGNYATYFITAFQISSNQVTFTCPNSLIAGLYVNIQGLSVGTYLNNVPFTVISATSTQFVVNFTHANVGLTSDSGTVQNLNNSLGLVPSPLFGNSFQMMNYGTVAWTYQTVLFQSAYQDWHNVAILQPNTAYSVRLTGRALNAGNQEITVSLLTYANGVFGTQSYGQAIFTLQQGAMTIQTETLTGTAGIPVIPSTLVIALGAYGITPYAGVQIDRIEVYPTNNPVDTTTIWTSYAGNFEAVDGVTGSLGCGVDNPQPAQGAYNILSHLFIEKTNSCCVTEDSPNYEPNQWTVNLSAQGVGAVGPNAFDSQEEFSLKASRSGVYLFDGGKPEPISRELQASGTNGSVWETINWAAGKTIWLRNDVLNRRFYVGVPMIVPNKWLPNATALTPIQPNVILMCNYTGCPTAAELLSSPGIHTTMFGDLKALDMRRKWSIWQIACPIAEFLVRPDGLTNQLFLANGINSSKIYQLANGAAVNGQNTDDGAAINWVYTTYGFTKAKQGQQNPSLGALRKVWTYFTATMEGVGQVAVKFYSNTLGATYPFTTPLPITLSSPAQNDQERVIEIGGQRVFVQFSSLGTGGYCEIGTIMLDGDMDKHFPHRGVSS